MQSSHFIAGVVVLASCLASPSVHAQATESATGLAGVPRAPALEYVAQQLATNRVIFLGESHRLRQLHAFYRELIEAPAMRGVLDDVVVEFLSSHHQGLLDRYVVQLEVMEFEELAPAWRDVPGIVLESGDDMAALGLIEAVRKRNEGLPLDQRLRLVAADSAIDWTNLKGRREWATQLNRRDLRFVEVVWDEVLDRGRRCLVILGRAHVKRIDPSPPNWINVVDILDARADGETHVIHLFDGELAEQEWKAPVVVSTRDTFLRDLRLEKQAPHLRFGQQVDAVLFVASPSEFENIPNTPLAGILQTGDGAAQAAGRVAGPDRGRPHARGVRPSDSRPTVPGKNPLLQREAGQDEVFAARVAAEAERHAGGRADRCSKLPLVTTLAAPAPADKLPQR